VYQVSIEQAHADGRRVQLLRPIERQPGDLGLLILAVVYEGPGFFDQFFGCQRHGFSSGQ